MPRDVFQIYPRGFFGAVLEDLPDLSVSAQSQRVKALQYDSSMFQMASPKQAFNSDVERLYKQYITSPATVMNHEFYKRVVSVALKAFGTDSFSAWYLAQRSSPFFTDHHKAFLEDSMRFMAGRTISGYRKLGHELWEPLISSSLAAAPGSMVAKNPPEYEFSKNISVEAAIQMWCQRRNGVYDLLRTLHILFGEK